jgi:hypothetical protein
LLPVWSAPTRGSWKKVNHGRRPPKAAHPTSPLQTLREINPLPIVFAAPRLRSQAWNREPLLPLRLRKKAHYRCRFWCFALVQSKEASQRHPDSLLHRVEERQICGTLVFSLCLADRIDGDFWNLVSICSASALCRRHASRCSLFQPRQTEEFKLQASHVQQGKLALLFCHFRSRNQGVVVLVPTSSLADMLKLLPYTIWEETHVTEESRSKYKASRNSREKLKILMLTGRSQVYCHLLLVFSSSRKQQKTARRGNWNTLQGTRRRTLELITT